MREAVDRFALRQSGSLEWDWSACANRMYWVDSTFDTVVDLGHTYGMTGWHGPAWLCMIRQWQQWAEGLCQRAWPKGLGLCDKMLAMRGKGCSTYYGIENGDLTYQP